MLRKPNPAKAVHALDSLLRFLCRPAKRFRSATAARPRIAG
jgi:hypothetical protein